MAAAAHPRNPIAPETVGLRGWAATLPRALAMGFFRNASSGLLCMLDSAMQACMREGMGTNGQQLGKGSGESGSPPTQSLGGN